MTADLGYSHEIALMAVGEDASGPLPGQGGLNHMACYSDSLENLKDASEHLRAHGVQVERLVEHADQRRIRRGVSGLGN